MPNNQLALIVFLLYIEDRQTIKDTSATSVVKHLRPRKAWISTGEKLTLHLSPAEICQTVVTEQDATTAMNL